MHLDGCYVREGLPHVSKIVYCDGLDSPHAFDIVPLQPRKGGLDAMCPVCKAEARGI